MIDLDCVIPCFNKLKDNENRALIIAIHTILKTLIETSPHVPGID